MGQFSTITQEIKIKLKMKFLIPLLVIFATSDAFFFGIGRKSDSRDANPTVTDTEELARLLGEILVKELRNNNNDDDDHHNNKNHHNKNKNHHNNNNRYNNNNTPRPVRTYTPRPVHTYTSEPIVTIEPDHIKNHHHNNNKYNNNKTPRPVHTYTSEPIVTIEPDHIIYNTEPEVVHTY